MSKIKVVNIKCEGCKNRIIASLEVKGLKNVSIDIENQTVSFSGDEEVARNILDKMGYPEENDTKANHWFNKFKFYISYAKGKFLNK